MRCSSALFVAALAAAAPARADVEYSTSAFYYAENGPPSYQVEVRITGERDGKVVVPIGTVLAPEDRALQFLVLGEDVRADMEEGQTRVFVVHAYCMHERRSGPFEHTPLEERGVVRDPGLLDILRDDLAFGPRQAQIWAYLTPRRLRALLAGALPREQRRENALVAARTSSGPRRSRSGVGRSSDRVSERR